MCKIILLKENMDWFCKVFSHMLFFVLLCSQWSEGLHRTIAAHQQYLCQEKCIAKKIIHTIRALMVSQDIDLVAGDFSGTAWRCRSRDNISTIDEVFSDCALPTPPGPTPLWGSGSIPNNWADVCGFLKPLNVFGK